MSYATLDDIKARWPAGLPVPVDTVLQAWLSDAELLIRARYPELDDLIEWYGTDTGDDSVLATVVLVECRVAVRALTQPARPVIREQVGDTSVAYQPGGIAFGLDSEDLALLDGRFGMYRWITAPRLTDFGDYAWQDAGYAW